METEGETPSAYCMSRMNYDEIVRHMTQEAARYPESYKGIDGEPFDPSMKAIGYHEAHQKARIATAAVVSVAEIAGPTLLILSTGAIGYAVVIGAALTAMTLKSISEATTEKRNTAIKDADHSQHVLYPDIKRNYDSTDSRNITAGHFRTYEPNRDTLSYVLRGISAGFGSRSLTRYMVIGAAHFAKMGWDMISPKPRFDPLRPGRREVKPPVQRRSIGKQ